MALKYFLFALLVAAITASGNMVLKIGAAKESWLPFAWLPPVNGYFILGAGLFAASLLVYMLLLKDLPLYVAQSMIAIQYVGVMIAARWGLGEKMSVTDIVGMAFILFGIFLVANRSVE